MDILEQIKQSWRETDLSLYGYDKSVEWLLANYTKDQLLLASKLRLSERHLS